VPRFHRESSLRHNHNDDHVLRVFSCAGYRTGDSSLLGYAIGDFIWGLHQDSNGGAQLMISPDQVAVNWQFD
jgi:hypothetical protein